MRCCVSWVLPPTAAFSKLSPRPCCCFTRSSAVLSYTGDAISKYKIARMMNPRVILPMVFKLRRIMSNSSRKSMLCSSSTTEPPTKLFLPLPLFIVLDPVKHVPGADERQDIRVKVEEAVAGQVQAVPFVQDHVLFEIAFRQVVVKVQLGGLLFIPVPDQEYLFLGGVLGKTIGRTYGVQHPVGFIQLVQTGFVHLAQDKHPGGAPLDQVHAHIRVHQVFG